MESSEIETVLSNASSIIWQYNEIAKSPTTFLNIVKTSPDRI